MSVLRAQLKAHTRSQHDAIEGTRHARAMAAGTVSLEAYAGQVSAWAMLLTTLERAFEQSERPAFAEMPGRWSRAAHLHQDLDALRAAGPLPRPTQAATALARQIEAWVDDAALFGALYVFEGSALGGATLQKRLRAVHPELPTHALVPPDARGRWPAFLARLSELAPEDHARVVAGAERTFDGLLAIFEALAPDYS